MASAQCRKRDQSYTQAWNELEKRVQERRDKQDEAETSALRNSLTGSGMRADKIRTYRFQDDQVKDHNSGKTVKCKKVMRGGFDLLH